ncbi:MAG: UbiA family prenyltransferase [Candidatus Sumerlaeia bacterium]|nr:UbiA family prenyltransferase [Candidatus Sumerlaeia bacterium]
MFNTVCGATAQRQKEIKELAEKVDLMIVVGGRHSANTRRLVEISKQSGVPTIHIETAEELKLEEIVNYRNIGVTAGASTPHWVLRNVIEQLHSFEEQRRPLIIRKLLQVVRFLIYSQLYLAAGAGCVAYAVQVLLRLPVNPVLIVLAAAYVLSMHILNRYLSLPPEKDLLYGMQKYFSSHRQLMWLMGITAGILSLLVSFYLELTAIVLVALSLILGAVYSLAIIPPGCLPHLRYRRLMDIPGSKDLFTAIAWVMVTVIIPFLAHKGRVTLPTLCLSALTIMLLVLVRSFIYDIREIEEDLIVGRETIPIILGLRRIQTLIFVLIGLMGVSLLSGWLLTLFPALSLLMLLTIGYIIFAYGCRWSAEFYHSLAYDALIDGQFILVGILAYIWRHFLQ